MLEKMRNGETTKEGKHKYSIKHIFRQNLREQCVYQSLKNKKSHWFIYIKQLMDMCVFDYSEEKKEV